MREAVPDNGAHVDPAISDQSLSTFAMAELLSGRVEPVRRQPATRRAATSG
jgi:hypothetical protein